MQLDDEIDIRHFLPHREPMLMVDKLSHINENEVSTVFEIKQNTLFVQDGKLNEFGLIENAAQTCSGIVAKSYFFDENNQEKENVKVIGFISGIKELNVFDFPPVGSIIHSKSNLISQFNSTDYTICTMKCSTFLEDKLLFDAVINLYIQEDK